jgi:hypothetical protein
MGVNGRSGEKIKIQDWTLNVIENKPKNLPKEIRKELEN